MKRHMWTKVDNAIGTPLMISNSNENSREARLLKQEQMKIVSLF